MGFRRDITRSQIFQESSDQFNEMWFGFKRDKFLHNIDTFYYTVSLEGDCNKNPQTEKLLEELKYKKALFLETQEIQEFSDKLYVCRGRFDDVYDIRLTCPDKYDIFVTNYLLNNKTPRFVVQLRSTALWIDGVKETIEDSYYQLIKIIEGYGLKVGNVYENRIDYCYHTNYIQNMYSFFDDKKVQKELKTNMTNWRKDGHTYKDGWDLNYFALGSRNSNNVFIRIYDKTREVVEMAYKGFFIEVWFKEGLISYYDKYVLEYAYSKGSYEKIYEGMLNFYMEFGEDDLQKREITHYLQDSDINFYEIKKIALALMPQPTTICNIEFQTKRKFYSSGDSVINSLDNIIKTSDKLLRLIKIVDNRKIFLDYLTHYNMRFVDEKGDYLSWWKRLRGLKMEILDTGKEYARDYQKELDKKKMFKKTMQTLGVNSLYNGSKLDANIYEDILDYVNSLNDNDIYNSMYVEYKEKRYRTLENQLSNMYKKYECEVEEIKKNTELQDLIEYKTGVKKVTRKKSEKKEITFVHSEKDTSK